MQTVSGTVDVSSLTPAEQALLDEIAQFRQDVQVPDLNPYDVNFWNINPLIRQRYFAAQQSRLGIPAEAFEWEVGRMRIPGLSRDQVAVGY